MGTAASSSLRGSSVPGLPLMVLGGLLHRSRSWRGAVLTLHSLVGLLYRPVVASHLPRASGSPRHQSAPSNARACPGAGPHALTIIRIKKPGLNRLYCGGVSECTMSKNLTWPVLFSVSRLAKPGGCSGARPLGGRRPTSGRSGKTPVRLSTRSPHYSRTLRSTAVTGDSQCQ